MRDQISPPRPLMDVPRRIAVYGTLRRGHGLFANMIEPALCDGRAIFVGDALTEPAYTLHSFGGCPGLAEGGETAVRVEVYEIRDRVLLQRLDRIEGAYDRKPVRIGIVWTKRAMDEGGAGGHIDIGSVEVYVAKNVRNAPVIASGDWTAHVAERRAAEEERKSHRRAFTWAECVLDALNDEGAAQEAFRIPDADLPRVGLLLQRAHAAVMAEAMRRKEKAAIAKAPSA